MKDWIYINSERLLHTLFNLDIFFERLDSSKELYFYKDLIIYLEIKYGKLLCTSRLLVVLLYYKDFSFRIYYNVRIMTLISKE